jgi:phosphate/sulfate permease
MVVLVAPAIFGAAPGAGLSDDFSANDVAKAIGPLLMAALGALMTRLTAGSAVAPAMATLLSLVGGTCFLAFSLLYRRCGWPPF